MVQEATRTKNLKGRCVSYTFDHQTYAQIKLEALKRDITVTRLVGQCIVDTLSLGPLTTVARSRKGNGKVEVNKHIPQNPNHKEQDTYYCPVCRGPMEVTDDRDRIDHWGGPNIYHSRDLQFECGHCKGGLATTINMPWPQ